MTIRLLIISALLLLGGPAHGLVVDFAPAARVDAVSITLGDIVTFDEKSDLSAALRSQVVGPSPPPGESQTLSANAIIRSLLPAIPPGSEVSWSGSATIEVTRTAVTVTAEQISQHIDGYLAQHRGELPEAEIRFVPSELPIPFVLPVGDVTCEVTPSNPNIVGSSRFVLIFRVDGRVRKNMSVRGRLEMLAPVAVLTTPLKKGDVISTSHLSMAIRDLSEIKEPCLDMANVIGLTMKSSVKAGEPLSMYNVIVPPMVRKGELVRIILNHKGMNLTATGLAQSDGKLRETIRVQNTSSKKTVYCRVAAPGVVEVTL